MKEFKLILLTLFIVIGACKPTPTPTCRSKFKNAENKTGEGDAKKPANCYASLRLSADITNTLATYDRGIHMFLDANCVSCHGDPEQKNGLDFRTFNGVFPNGGKIITQIKANHKSGNDPYADTVKALFVEWQVQKYAENPFAKDPQDTNPPVSFAKQIRPFLDEKCISCHNVTKTEGNTNLTIDTEVKEKGKNIVQKVFENHNGNYLLPDREMFKEWETSGYKIVEKQEIPQGGTPGTPVPTGTGTTNEKVNIEDGGTLSYDVGKDPCEVAK